MRWRCAAGIFHRSAVLSRRTSALLHFPRIRWRSESHLGQQKQPAVPAPCLKNPPIQAVMEVVLDAGKELLNVLA
jgi:hypothetical protein